MWSFECCGQIQTDFKGNDQVLLEGQGSSVPPEACQS